MARNAPPTALTLLTVLALLAAGCGGGGGNGNNDRAPLDVRDVLPGAAVRVFQVDFFHPQGDVLDSSWGRLRIDPALLAVATGLQGGFLNVAMGPRWVAVNIPILATTEPPYAVYFDLGLAQTQKLDLVTLTILHSNQGLGGFDEHGGQPADHAVERWEFSAEQLMPVPGPGIPPPARLVTDSIAAAFDTTTVTQVVTNVQCAHNQCMTMASANAIQYLEDMGQITLPHPHVPGEFGDATLVGQFDALSGRPGTSRTSGTGLSVTDMVEGTFEYLFDNTLTTVLNFRHENDGEAWTMLGAAGGDYSAHSVTSWSDSLACSHGWLYDRLAEGSGVVLVYRRDGSGGHAGRITAAGFDDTGRRWFRFTHDASQTNRDLTDSAGLENVICDWSDLDADGTPNIWSAGREIRFVWAHRP